jgi:2-alkyl-3-oxoalkanoate reductase
MTRVFVAGAGGAIVRRLVPQLVARGHHVVASTTRTEKIADLRTFGAEALVMDGLDPASVGDAVARMMPDVVVHQMSALAGTDDLKQFDDTFATTKRSADERAPTTCHVPDGARDAETRCRWRSSSCWRA